MNLKLLSFFGVKTTREIHLLWAASMTLMSSMFSVSDLWKLRAFEQLQYRN